MNETTANVEKARETARKILDEPIDTISGMTEGEKRVMGFLMDSYGEFLKIPRQHPDEMRDFVDGIHRIQDVIACRIVRRHYPEYWPTHGVQE